MKNSKDVYFRRTDSGSSTTMVFDQDMVNLLLAIDEKKAITEIAKEIQQSPSVFKRCLVKLYKLKLIEKIEPKVEYINGQFLNKVHDELIHLLGPIGEILMDDAEEQLNLDESKVPKNLVDDYLMAITNKIPGDTQKKRFQENIQGELNSLNGD